MAIHFLVQAGFVAATHAVEHHHRESLGTEIAFDQQLVRHFGSNEGLPSNWINDILQTRDSFIWIGTDNGLVRYDGSRFKLISDALTQQSPVSEIRGLYESRDGTLWIGTSGGLFTYRAGFPATYQRVASIPIISVFAVYEDARGAIWVGTAEETYIRPRGQEFAAIPSAPKDVRAICEAGGEIWMGANSGLFRQRGDEFERIVHERLPSKSSLSGGVLETRVNALLVDNRGELWIGANRGLLHFRDGEFTMRGQEEEIGNQQIYQITETRNDALYLAARFGVYRAVGESAFVQVSSTDSARCVMEDQLGRFWVGHGNNRGLNRYQNRPARKVWAGSRVRCVHENEVGDLWFGSNLGLHVMRDGLIRDFTVDDGLPGPKVTTIISSRDDSMWIGTAQGLVRWKGSAAVQDSIAGLTEGMNIGCGLEDSSGTLWVALVGNQGFKLERDKLVALDSLDHGRIHWFWEGDEGSIWMGHTSGLYREVDNEIVQITDAAFEQLNNPRFQCYCEGENGELWLGTSNGILRYQSGQFETFPPSCGLMADNIERLTVDDRGNLWFAGRDGLFHASMDELDAFADGRLARITSYRVPGFDRCPPVNDFSQGCLVRDGELWMVSENSLTRMPLDLALYRPASPKVLIDRVTIDGLSTEFHDGFKMTSGKKRLAVEYAVPAFEHQEHVHVRYRLEGHDESWISGDRGSTAQYTDLRPGDYRFRVMARHGNGEWIESTEPVRFTVAPRWWELGWLRASAFCIVIAAIAGYSRHRLNQARRVNAELNRQIEQRMRAEEQSRENQQQLSRVTRAASMGEVSTSIAHEIKQPLFAIVSNAHTAKKLLEREAPDVDEVREALDDIAHDGNRASAIIDRIRAMVKKGHHAVQRLDLNQVVLDATSFAEPEMQKRGIDVTTELDPELPALAGDPVELQQVVLNLLLNGAQAMDGCEDRRIELQTCRVDDSVQVAVRDHGIGIDESMENRLFEPFFTTKPEGTGMGLAINRTIIEGHRGRIWAERNQNSGMTFRFRLPICSRETPRDAAETTG